MRHVHRVHRAGRVHRASRVGRVGDVVGVVGIILVVLLGASLGPARWGGALAAVTVRGSSMEPGIHAGDLVLVRRDPPYRIGDVVLHTAGPGGVSVLHRIVAVDGERMVLRGDANDHDDDVRPVARDIVGRMTLRIPRAARSEQRGPVLGACSGAAALLLAMPAATRRRRRSRRSNRRRTVRH